MVLSDEKVLRVFGDIAVKKSLSQLDVVSRLPRFIAEYLISKYYRLDHDRWDEKLRKIVSEYHPDPSARDLILSRAREEGKITLIDEFKVTVDLKEDMYYLHIPSLRIFDALVSDSIVKRYVRILVTGLWGIGVLAYRPEVAELQRPGKKKQPTPLELIDFEPFQVYNIDLDSFVESRRQFSSEEWVELLVRSIGLNPERYDWRQRMLLLFRLVPLVEGNVNLMELGPRATGKSYLYRNISYYTRIYAGGTVSPATLFYNARLNILGDIGVRDAVVFDEVARLRFQNPEEIVPKLKDYMESGYFERGRLERGHSTCSLVFLGNVELGSHGAPSDVLDYLPEFMRDSAMLDRVHALIPGWELPKIAESKVHLATGYGLAADYLSEIMHRLRLFSYESLVDSEFELTGHYTIRDEKAVKKLISGIFKLVYPHLEYDRSEVREVARLAVELRQNVVNLLSSISPYEFSRNKLGVEVRG